MFPRFAEANPQKGRAVLFFLAKGVVFLLLLSALFIRYPIQPVSFTLGVSLLLLTCMIVTLFGSRIRSQEAGLDERKS
jgi:hypothetical protein